MSEMYDDEITVYEANLADWLPANEGKWVIINGQEILGIYDTKADAYTAAAAKYGDAPYLARHIQAEQAVLPAPFFLVDK